MNKPPLSPLCRETIEPNTLLRAKVAPICVSGQNLCKPAYLIAGIQHRLLSFLADKVEPPCAAGMIWLSSSGMRGSASASRAEAHYYGSPASANSHRSASILDLDRSQAAEMVGPDRNAGEIGILHPDQPTIRIMEATVDRRIAPQVFLVVGNHEIVIVTNVPLRDRWLKFVPESDPQCFRLSPNYRIQI